MRPARLRCGCPRAEPTGDEATGQAEGARPEDCEIFWIGPADAIRLFRATLCTIRRRIERVTGRLPSEGEGFEAMLDHARSTTCAAFTPG